MIKTILTRSCLSIVTALLSSASMSIYAGDAVSIDEEKNIDQPVEITEGDISYYAIKATVSVLGNRSKREKVWKITERFSGNEKVYGWADGTVTQTKERTSKKLEDTLRDALDELTPDQLTKIIAIIKEWVIEDVNAENEEKEKCRELVKEWQEQKKEVIKVLQERTKQYEQMFSKRNSALQTNSKEIADMFEQVCKGEYNYDDADNEKIESAIKQEKSKLSVEEVIKDMKNTSNTIWKFNDRCSKQLTGSESAEELEKAIGGDRKLIQITKERIEEDNKNISE